MFEENIKAIDKKIKEVLKNRNNVLIAIDGNCGAGKSTIGSELAAYFSCNLFHMDDFYLTPDLKTEDRSEEPGGNVDYVRFKHEVINQLMLKKPFEYEVYKCHNDSFHKSGIIQPHKINIIEGSYSMHPTLIESYDVKIYLETSKEVQYERIIKRNGPDEFKEFKSTWIPLENYYFQTLKIREKCDIVIDTAYES